MNVLEALQNEYDLTLFTFTPPDLADLNGFSNTGIDTGNISVVCPRVVRYPLGFTSAANRLSVASTLNL